MKELSIRANYPTKEAISSISMTIIEQVRNGEIDPLETVTQLSAIEKACEIIREGISEIVVAELDKEQGKTTRLGAKIDRKEVGVKWVYDNEAWKSIKAQEDGISERRKAVEKICQNIPEGTQLNWTDESTGETYTLTRGAKSSKTGFAVKLGE